MPFTTAWSATSVVEKGYVNHPSDKGGPTNHGITERVARMHGWTGDMRDLPKEFADRVAKEQYWDTLRLDDVETVSVRVASEMFDTGFLAGIGTSGRFFQESLNELNRQQADYDDIGVDNIIGRMTVGTFRLYMQKRSSMEGERVMLVSLNVKLGSYLQSLAQRDKRQEDFLYGWLRSRVGL